VYPYIPATPLDPPPRIALAYPIALAARQRNQYFVPPQGFDLFGMFQNPMMLMMVAAAILMVAMPSLLVRPPTRPPSLSCR